MVEQWVEGHFGTLDDMLMSTIVCQMDLTNFFYMKQDDQKKILDHALQLGSIAAFAKVLKEAMLAYNDWISLLRASLQSICGTAKSGGSGSQQESGILCGHRGRPGRSGSATCRL